MIFAKNEKFISGNQAVIEGALEIGANLFSGYPITPTTEIAEEWSRLHDSSPHKYHFIQAEDETSAGFNVIGAILAGAKAFTATAGPGNILMQDPISMAEAMRLPFVGIIMQRGGPSTGTVIYGQQEVNLTCFGGNGEGWRNVYSIANPQEAYDYTIKAFNTAYYTNFPTFVLGDGYIAKMKQKVTLSKPKFIIKPKPMFAKNINMRNCYNFENELFENLQKNKMDWDRCSKKIQQSETFMCHDADTIFVAHGIVSQAVMEAVKVLRNKDIKVGMFRPITLRPFDYHRLSDIASRSKKIIVVESSFGQLENIVKSLLYGLTKIEYYQKPALLISVEEIIDLIK